MAAESSRVIRDATGADASVLLEIYAPSIRETAISFEFEVPTVDEFAARIEKVLETGLWIVRSRGMRTPRSSEDGPPTRPHAKQPST